MRRHLWSALVGALSLAGVVGCTQCGGQKPLFPNAPWNKDKACGCKTTRPPAGVVGVAPGQPVPAGPEASALPPGAVATPPPGSTVIQPQGGQAPLSGTQGNIPQAPAPSAPVEIRGYGPVSDSTWHAPTNGGVTMAIPEAAPSRESVRLSQPEVPGAPPKPIISESRTAEPPAAPADIPHYNQVYDKVASGERPINLEGLEWLKSNGFHTALYLRRTTDNETSDRRQIENRGMKYLSIEVQPQNLRENLDQFNQYVNNSGNYPLFVYAKDSKDSMIIGSLWYLRFRTVDRMSESEARAKAARLGLQEEQTEANRPMWLAIQKTLEQVR